MNETQLRKLYIKVHTQFVSLTKTPDALALLIHEASLLSEDPRLIELSGQFQAEVLSLPLTKAGKHRLHTCADNALSVGTGRDCVENLPFYAVVDKIVTHTSDCLENDRPVWAVIALANGWKPMDEIT